MVGSIYRHNHASNKFVRYCRRTHLSGVEVCDCPSAYALYEH